MITKREFVDLVMATTERIIKGEKVSIKDIESEKRESIYQIARATADKINALYSRLECGDSQTENQLYREVDSCDLSETNKEEICLFASRLVGIELPVSECNKAIEILREQGFIVVEFQKTRILQDDVRLKDPPEDWFFSQCKKNEYMKVAALVENVIMICEIREKPDVVDEIGWAQRSYENDPFSEELKELHKNLNRETTTCGKVAAESRAGFTYSQLINEVLPRLSSKVGLQISCMSQIHASVLVNNHPQISSGRSTEWRADLYDDNHAIISGRSERGPIKYVYFDWKEDPYSNRGFRVCIILSNGGTDGIYPSRA